MSKYVFYIFLWLIPALLLSSCRKEVRPTSIEIKDPGEALLPHQTRAAARYHVHNNKYGQYSPAYHRHTALLRMYHH